MVATSEAGVAYPSGVPELIIFCSIYVTLALVFSVVLCVLCLSFISFCWPWSSLSSELTISDCLFGIFEFILTKGVSRLQHKLLHSIALQHLPFSPFKMLRMRSVFTGVN